MSLRDAEPLTPTPPARVRTRNVGEPPLGMGASTELHKQQSRDELAVLVVSSAITELSMSLQEVSTLIFELQELRHTTTVPASPPPAQPNIALPPATSQISSYTPSEDSFASIEASSPSRPSDSTPEMDVSSSANLSQVDSALVRLDGKLEVVTKEYEAIEKQIAPLLKDSESDEEIAFLSRKWKEVTEEWEATQKDAENLGEELKEDKWLTVFRTVSQQAESMMVSLEKVLKQSHEFIWDLQRRTNPSKPSSSTSSTPSKYLSDPAQLQPLLSSFVALHRSLHAKIKYYSPACDRVLKILGKGIADRSTKNGEVLRRFGEMKIRWRNLLERIGRIEAEMAGVEGMLRDAAEVTSTPKPDEKERKKEESPLRRFTNKMTGGAVRSASAGNLSTLAATPSPPRPPRSDKRNDLSASTSSATGTPRVTRPSPSPSSVAPSARSAGLTTPSGPSHRYSHSLSSSLAPPPPFRQPRGVSPVPSSSNGSEKPRWNISTRRVDERETLRESAPGSNYRRRPSLAQSQSSAGHSSTGGRRSAAAFRSVSPAFSDASSAGHRNRAATPSKIPAPRASLGSSVGGPRSTTPFSSLKDPEPTSLLQRTMTPTPSQSSLSHTSPTLSPSARSRSRLPTPTSGALSPPRALSPSYSNRGQTPEPSLMANAQRLYNVRRPSLVPPVPSLPSSLSTAPNMARRPSRPPSSLSQSYTARHGSFSPTPSHGRGGGATPTTNGRSRAATDGPYVPNPIDPLDKTLAAVLSSLPIALQIERLDRALTREAASSGGGQSARYSIGLGNERNVVTCKIVDRLGPRAVKGEKKVLVRQGTGWMELEGWGMGVIAEGLMLEP